MTDVPGGTYDEVVSAYNPTFTGDATFNANVRYYGDPQWMYEDERENGYRPDWEDVHIDFENAPLLTFNADFVFVGTDAPRDDEVSSVYIQGEATMVFNAGHDPATRNTSYEFEGEDADHLLTIVNNGDWDHGYLTNWTVFINNGTARLFSGQDVQNYGVMNVTGSMGMLTNHSGGVVNLAFGRTVNIYDFVNEGQVNGTLDLYIRQPNSYTISEDQVVRLLGGALDGDIRMDGGNDRLEMARDGMGLLTGAAYGGDGGDVMLGSRDGDIFHGDRNGDLLMGYRGDDSLYGGHGLDTLHGSAGNDLLDGGTQDDKLSGGQDNDTLVGGGGADTMTGGEGVDHFVFADAGDLGRKGDPDFASWERINDFEVGIDKLDFSMIDADPETAGDQAMIFLGTEMPFTGTAGEIRVLEAVNYTMLSIDFDGDGAADAGLRLRGVTGLTEADFIL